MKQIDARKQACPLPVIMAKKEIEAGEVAFEVVVDNKIAVENLKKFAKSQQFECEVVENGEEFFVSFLGNGESKEQHAKEEQKQEIIKESFKNLPNDYSIFIGRDGIGEGDKTLGRTLMQMFLYTVTEYDHLPKSILIMNGGVLLPVEDEQCVKHLQKLMELGVEVIVCGTCLNYYGIAEKLQVGTIGNMYEIFEKMERSGKVITL